MIVGDVGSGKTMVILASAYMMLPRRSILMAPTTILANQLFEEAQKFLPDMQIALVTNKSKKEELSGYDFVIGTHALLYRDLDDIGLVMIDEQHRFGTAQRNKLSKMLEKNSARPHFLQFSATPIPRTQAMINSALLDVSLITQTPFKKDISTRVIRKSDFAELLEHIKEEIDKIIKNFNSLDLVNEIMVPCRVCNTVLSITVKRSFIENSESYPVPLVYTHEGHAILCFIDKNYAVRGVELVNITG